MHQHQALFDNGPLPGGTAFFAPLQLITAHTISDVPTAFTAMEAARANGYWLAGYASYELGYALLPKLQALMPKKRDLPLLNFGVFKEPTPAKWPDVLGAATLTSVTPLWDQTRYDQAYNTIKNYIAAGDIYQANLTFPLRGQFSGTPEALYNRLRQRQSAPYGAFIDLGGPVLSSRSPELFFRIDASGQIEAKPMKGTAARGATPCEDADQIAWLQNSEKNRAENLMIVDLMRNDISRIAEIGSVVVPDLFTIETYETLHQMTSRITAQLLPNTNFHQIFEALFPCGSITGAPKIRAMQIIQELENGPRNAYCGSIGWIAPDQRAEFNVAIRTVICHENGVANLNVGGGIVFDSTATEEYDEALLKSKFAQLAVSQS